MISFFIVRGYNEDSEEEQGIAYGGESLVEMRIVMGMQRVSMRMPMRIMQIWTG